MTHPKDEKIILYGLKNITIIPNAVTLEHTKKAPFYDFKLPKGTLLLCLSRYYPLKNLEIFVPLAEEIKKRGLDFKIIITIDEPNSIATPRDGVIKHNLVPIALIILYPYNPLLL